MTDSDILSNLTSRIPATKDTTSIQFHSNLVIMEYFFSIFET